jgi:drug/metabolite transporter (DMT)-like permease
LLKGAIPKFFTALSLLPITYGVAYASTLGNLNIASMSKELTTVAAKLAMTSNVSFSMRSIVRKNLSSDFKSRTNLTAANDHAVTTILSMILLLPFLFKHEDIYAIADTIQRFPPQKQQNFYFNILVSGLALYLYNEMQNIVLGSLGAVPTAVGNTLKRVVIFVALYYCTVGETFPLPKVLGCAIAIVGCLLFAIFDSLKI